jgi:type IV secretory pathway TrbF-like protein
MSTTAFTPPAAVHPGGEDVTNSFKEALESTQRELRRVQRSLTNWQCAHGVQSLLNVVLVAAVVFLAGNVKVFPYVVEVAETG